MTLKIFLCKLLTNLKPIQISKICSAAFGGFQNFKTFSKEFRLPFFQRHPVVLRLNKIEERPSTQEEKNLEIFE